ncbi:MAG: hypothetical protein ACTSQA_08000 [Candidatus Heimdallarchaeaceae archaeon]
MTSGENFGRCVKAQSKAEKATRVPVGSTSVWMRRNGTFKYIIERIDTNTLSLTCQNRVTHKISYIIHELSNEECIKKLWYLFYEQPELSTLDKLENFGTMIKTDIRKLLFESN